MLKDDFFKILKFETEGAALKAVLELNPEHNIFMGHFPGTPVVPGVCMMQMVKEIVEWKVKKDLTLSKAGSMKFLSVIDPEINRFVNVDLSVKISDDVIDVSASLTTEERVCFKFKGLFFFSEEQSEFQQR